MPFIRIPNSAIPGFSYLSNLPIEKTKQLAAFLQEMPVGMSIDQVDDHVRNQIGIENSRQIIQTLISLSELLPSFKGDPNDLALDLSISYGANTGENEFTDEDKELLRQNLFILIRSAKNFYLTLKSIHLASIDNYIYHESRIVTDIRMVFDNELESSNRYGVLIHKLRIEHSKNGRQSETIFSLDLRDLNELKDNIERAIKKEELLRRDYDNSIHFIDVSSIL